LCDLSAIRRQLINLRRAGFASGIGVRILDPHAPHSPQLRFADEDEVLT
jgi:hypothetical protein